MEFTRQQAFLLAAAEVVPGDRHDLSDLLIRLPSQNSLENGTSLGSREGRLAEYIRSLVDTARVQFWDERLRRLGDENREVRLISIQDEGYPPLLRLSHRRPPFLFVDGSLDWCKGPTLAIVGSRAASSRASKSAYVIAAEAASRGVTVVSGLAAGIDAAAHRGALENGGQTVGVMATGIDSVYPPENEELAQSIREKGCLLSQFQPGSPPTKSTFLLRNGVISGVSLVSLIVQGGDRSGSQNEAEQAIAQSRPVLFWAPHMHHEGWAARFTQAYEGVYLIDSAEQLFSQVNERLRASVYS
jgi:DNA processing protein